MLDLELLEALVQLGPVEGVEARLAVDMLDAIAQRHELGDLCSPGRVPLERPDVADLRHEADRVGQLAVVRREQDGHADRRDVLLLEAREQREGPVQDVSRLLRGLEDLVQDPVGGEVVVLEADEEDGGSRVRHVASWWQ